MVGAEGPPLEASLTFRAWSQGRCRWQQVISLDQDLCQASFGMAFAEACFAALAGFLRAAVLADRVAWLQQRVQQRVDDMRLDLEAGCTRKLWRLVQAISGRRVRPARLATVMVDERGAVLRDGMDIVQAWERRFLDEFSGNGVIAEADAADSDRCPVGFATVAAGSSPLMQAEWAIELTAVCSRRRGGSAPGRDLVVGEVLRAGGYCMAARLAQTAEAASGSGIPSSRCGGHMVPVPQKPAVPLGLGNSRGVLCS